jgi:hypothetical protein
MASEIYKYSNTPIETKIYWRGELLYTTEPVWADVYDITEDPAINPPIDPGTMIDSWQAHDVEEDPGTYRLYLPFDIANRNRSLKIIWRYENEYENGQHITYVNVVTPYVEMSDVIQDLNLGSDPSDPNYKTYHQLQMAEKYARKIIDNYCNQTFSEYDDVQIAYGSGTDILPLPFKITTIHELYENDVLLYDGINEVNNWIYTPQIAENGFGIRVSRPDALDNMVYTANGMVPPSINDRGWHGAFKKDARYRVQGKFGWHTVPDNVQEAAAALMQDFFSRDNTWKNKYVKRISTFDWQFEFTGDATKGTGNLYADQLLNPYIINGMVVI